jgi:hypothetical protein
MLKTRSKNQKKPPLLQLDKNVYASCGQFHLKIVNCKVNSSQLLLIDRNIFKQDGVERLVLSWGPVNIDIGLRLERVLPDESSCRTYEYGTVEINTNPNNDNTHGCNGTVLEEQASGVSLRNIKI